jgi:hypothetical protein
LKEKEKGNYEIGNTQRKPHMQYYQLYFFMKDYKIEKVLALLKLQEKSTYFQSHKERRSFGNKYSCRKF